MRWIKWLKHYYYLATQGVRRESTTAVLLKNTLLFKHLRRKKFNKLCRAGKYETYYPGELIIREGDIGDTFYVIEKGSVRVFTVDDKGEMIVLARLNAGAYFGEQALLDIIPRRRNASIRAITEVRLLEIPHADLLNALNSNKALREKLQAAGDKQLIQKYLHQTRLFHSYSRDFIQQIEGKICEFEDKSIIFKKDDTPEHVYLIISGEVSIQLQKEGFEDWTVVLGPGQIFGEASTLNKKLRSGTAIAQGKLTVLAVDANVFLKYCEAQPKLREIVRAMQRIYKLPQRGTVTITKGQLMGLDSIKTIYHLDNDKKITAYQAVGKALFTVQIHNMPYTECLRYDRGEVMREIVLAGHKIVGLTSVGQWDIVDYICGMMLEGVELNARQLKSFKKTGTFDCIEEAQDNSDNKILCHCLNLTRDDIADAIHEGAVNLKTITDKTGVGKVCGGCVYKLNDMLGRSARSVVYITNVEVIAPDIRIYQLKAAQPISYAYKPGQYISVQALIGKHWVERDYSLISICADKDYYEIVVKREPQGYFSKWLFEHDREDPLLRVSPPQGNFIFDVTSKQPAVFFAGGIGVTPAYAFARALVAEKGRRRLHIDYSVHDKEHALFSQEFIELTKQNSNLSFHQRVTDEEGEIPGREVALIVREFSDALFYVSGPGKYQHFITEILKENGIPEHRIKLEVFVPAGGPLSVS